MMVFAALTEGLANEDGTVLADGANFKVECAAAVATVVVVVDDNDDDDSNDDDDDDGSDDGDGERAF